MSQRERLGLRSEHASAVRPYWPIAADGPQLKGGPSWVENEVVACRRCNAARGHTSPADWFAECERRGWKPNLMAVVGVLRGLDAAIATRGGQRRARPYLAGHLRRLAALAGGR